MRAVQIAILVLGTASFVGSAFGLGPDHGAMLYKVGFALLLIGIACTLLWPPAVRVRPESPERPGD